MDSDCHVSNQRIQYTHVLVKASEDHDRHATSPRHMPLPSFRRDLSLHQIRFDPHALPLLLIAIHLRSAPLSYLQFQNMARRTPQPAIRVRCVQRSGEALSVHVSAACRSRYAAFVGR
jgi:hypothetical protein